MLERRQLDLGGALAPGTRRTLVRTGQFDPLERFAYPFPTGMDRLFHASECYSDLELLA
jgi:hypothetical protein